MNAAPTAPIDIETARLAIRALGTGDEDRLQRVFAACADHFAALTGQPGPAPDAAAHELRLCDETWGRQVAVLTRRPQGYFITHVEGLQFPIVNGKALDAQAYKLNDHDVIVIAGIKMEFFLKS